jgi:transcriptional regulator with XRE-family HTH domain
MEDTRLRLDGERVREGRERLALSIENVSAKARVSPHTWVRAEHGEEIRPSSVRRIAEALGVEPGQLMGELVLPGKAEAPSPPEVSEEERRAEDENRGEIEGWTRFVNEWAGDLEEWAYGFHKGTDPALLDESEFLAFVGGMSAAAPAYRRARKTVESLVNRHNDEDLAKAWRRLSRAIVDMATPAVEQRLDEILERGGLPDNVVALQRRAG